jgi:hypothetical protein
MQNVIWSGSLAPLQFVDDTIATITLLGGTHNLVAFTSNPNNTNDDYTLNDKRSITIAVSATIAAYPFAEGFEGNVFPPADWFQSSSVLWAQDNNVGGYGNTAKSAIANFYTVISGTDNLATMRIDLTNAITNPYLSFAHAYARYSAIYSDTLAISISNDCGDNWNTVFMQHDDSLATVANFVTGPFVPAANEWRTTMIDLSAYMGQQIKVRFEARSGYGNYLYLDDINLLHSFTSLQDAHDLSDLEVFPNPATGLVYVNDANKKIKNIYIYDALGKLVYSNTNYKPHEPIDMSAFQQSMYYIKLQTSEKMETRKLNLIK